MSDFQEGLVRVFDVEGVDVAVVHLRDRFYAFGGRCTHANYSFNYTRVRQEDMILCSSHHAWFEIATGQVWNPPTDDTGNLPLYEVRLEDGKVFVSLL